MDQKGKKFRVNLKVSPEIHREIDIESATSGRPIYFLVEEAWKAYKNARDCGNTKKSAGTLQNNVYSSGNASPEVIAINAKLDRILEMLVSLYGEIDKDRTARLIETNRIAQGIAEAERIAATPDHIKKRNIKAAPRRA